MTYASEQRQFGLWRTTALVVGNMIGTSIFILPASLGAFGSLSLLGWIVTSLGAMALALSFGRLSKRESLTGGPYAYSRKAFGDFIGFQMAWSYWIVNWVSNAAVCIAFVNFVGYVFPEVLSPLYSLGLSLITLWSLTLLNSVSLKGVGNLQLLVTLFKIIPFALIGVFGVFYMKPENFQPFLAEGKSGLDVVNAAAAMTLFSFLGLESATVPAGHVEDPERTIPRATILGTLLTAVIYIWMNVVIFGVISPEGAAASHAPFSQVATEMFGSRAGLLIALCAAISCFGTLNGWILLQGQVPMAAAQDGLFPRIFGKLSSKKLPVFGLVFSSVLVSFLLLLNYEAGLVEQFEFIIKLTAFAVLIPYLFSAAADLLFLLREKDFWIIGDFWRAVFGSTLAIFYALWTFVGAGAEIVYLGSFLIFGCVPVYVWMRAREPQA